MWESFIGEIVGAVVTLVISAIGIYGGTYLKRMEVQFKRKMVLDEISKYTQWADGAKSFKLMSVEEKIETVFARASEFAMENDIQISEKELMLMVERTVQSPNRLESIGRNLMKRNLERKQGEKENGVIEK